MVTVYDLPSGVGSGERTEDAGTPHAVSLVWVSSHPAHPQVTLAEFQDYYSGLSGSVDSQWIPSVSGTGEQCLAPLT